VTRPLLVVSESIDASALPPLRAEAELVHDPTLYADRKRLKSQLAAAQALIVRNQTRVDADLLTAAPDLRVVGRLGVGLDNLDLDACRAAGVRVTWAPGTNAASVAEYVLGAALSLARRFEAISRELHAGRWDRAAAVGGELLGRTLGIVGLGDIGARLAKRARAFGLEVIASDPALHPASFAVQEYGVRLLPLETLLTEADIVSLHVPLLPATRHMIDAEALARMGPETLLINTARGGLIDETALATALRDGRLGGAALDVRASEPPGDDDPLKGLPNLILTPHVAGVTREASRRASLRVAEDVLAVLSGGRPVNELRLG
jgi:D-3-phosphoglycerate dehydrogenase